MVKTWNLEGRFQGANGDSRFRGICRDLEKLGDYKDIELAVFSSDLKRANVKSLCHEIITLKQSVFNLLYVNGILEN